MILEAGGARAVGPFDSLGSLPSTELRAGNVRKKRGSMAVVVAGGEGSHGGSIDTHVGSIGTHHRYSCGVGKNGLEVVKNP